MKKEYMKPELNTQAYAQFENVYAGCDFSPGNWKYGHPCTYDPSWPAGGPGSQGFTAHSDYMGPIVPTSHCQCN